MIRALALLLTVLTGFSGLVYEVAWQKYLATLLGSHAEATAAVLAIFLGGLSAGYALFGAVTHRAVEASRRRGRPPALLGLYGMIEASIGAWALLFPFLFGLVQRLSLWLPHANETVGFALDVGLTVLLLGPPTALMGGTIPILTLALAGSVGGSTRVHAWIYGFNTVGAFAGALAGGFWLVPALGLDGVLYAMGAVNLFAGTVFVLLDRRGAELVPDLAPAPAGAAPGARFAAYAAVAALAGFAMMVVQTTLNRIGGLSFGASHFTFAMVVAVFVCCIAVGSLVVSLLPRIPAGLIAGSQWLLALLLLALYFHLPDATYWAHRIRTVFNSSEAAFYPYYLFSFACLFAVLCVPIGLSGALLPLLFHQLRREAEALGQVAGRLYSWNTVGSLAGALLGGYLLLIWLDLHHVYRIALAALALSAALVSGLVLRGRARAVGVLAAVPFVAALFFLPPWDPYRLAAGLFRQREPVPGIELGPDAVFAKRHRRNIRFYDDDPTTSVAVADFDAGGGQRSLQIVVNGKSDGSLIGDYATMDLAGLLPALLADRRTNAFVIGFGTGVTAGELAALEDVRSVEVAEISRGVIAGAPLFDAGNQGASKSPKVAIHRGDAYRTLLRSDRRYDVIASEPSNPWVTGVEMLFSREFLEAARSRLAPGGVYAQWFHVYETNLETVELVLRTYASVFPNVSVWFTMSTDILLVATDGPEAAPDLGALAARFARPDFAAGFARAGIQTLPALLAHELLPFGAVHAMDLVEGPLHTLRNPILSDRAARGFFVGGIARMPRYVRPPDDAAAARASLLRRLAARPDGSLPVEVIAEAARETCRLDRMLECATWFAAWESAAPGSPERASELARLSRKQNAHQALAPQNLALLATLEPGAPRPSAGAPVPTERAVAATEAFLRHYLHAAPFDRGALVALWRRCEGRDCAQRRHQAERVLGPLGAGGGLADYRPGSSGG